MMTLQMDSRVGQILYSYKHEPNSYCVPFNAVNLIHLLNLYRKMNVERLDMTSLRQ